MANKPISQYEELETVSGDTVFVISRNGKTYGATINTLLESIENGGDD